MFQIYVVSPEESQVPAKRILKWPDLDRIERILAKSFEMQLSTVPESWSSLFLKAAHIRCPALGQNVCERTTAIEKIWADPKPQGQLQSDLCHPVHFGSSFCLISLSEHFVF